MNKKDFVLAFNFSAIFLLFTFNSFGKDVIRNNYITVIQENNFFKIENYFDSVQLNKSSFSIRFFNKLHNSDKKLFHAARIAVIPVSENIEIRTGQNLKEISCFEPGSGMAADNESGYNSVFISSSGHHYLFYENDNHKRVNLILNEKDLNEYEWKIDNFFYDDKDVRIEEAKLNELLFFILIDINLNNIVDNGELHTIKFKFK